MRLNSKNFHFFIPIGFTVTIVCPSRAQFAHPAGILKPYRLVCHSSKQVWEALQGVPTQTFIFHFALAGRNMQASFGLKVIWDS